jgi:thiol-disulfide isomerase/thioredoxin
VSGARIAMLAAVAALAAAACGGSGASGPTDGGRDTLPGPTPKGVSYQAPAEDAPQAPPFTLSLLDGTRFDVASLWNTRPVVVVFFASWCAECAKEQQALAPLIKRYGTSVGFVGIAAQDKAPAVRRYLRAHHVTYPVGIDGKLAIYRRYAMATPPGVALISRGGRLLRGWDNPVSPSVLGSQLRAIVR